MLRAPSPRRPLAILGLALAAIMPLLGLTVAALPAPTRAATHAVSVGDGFFSPATLTVGVGDTVTWTNEDDSPHTVTSAGGAFDSGTVDAGAAFSFTFTETGIFDYVCQFHDDMVGSIIVRAAAAAPSQAAAPSARAADAAASAPAAGGASGQPDTALPLPVPGIAAWMAPVLIGLGVLAFGFALVPGPRARMAQGERPMRRGGWQR